MGRGSISGCGTQTAGLCFGGNDGGTYEDQTEEYDGTSWSAGGDLGTARQSTSGAGIQTAALASGGQISSEATLSSCEEYNGTAWSAGGNLITARMNHGSAGTIAAGLAMGGNVGGDSVEEYGVDTGSYDALFNGQGDL